jgi:protein phosphatase
VRALLAVADGMGGLQGGDVASRTAIDAVRRAALEGGTPDHLALAVEVADREIRAIAAQTGDERSMGTTLTAALVVGNEATVVHVGDTRAYLLHEGRISQITEDHSRVGRLLAQGVISEIEAMHHPEQNVLERALGAGDASGDVYRVGLGSGDLLFLCSDGLHTFVTADEIAQELQTNPSLQAACERLARLAEERGSQDNITSLAWQYPSDEGGPEPGVPGATLVHRRRTGPPRFPGGRPDAQSTTGLAVVAGIVVASYVAGFGLGYLLAQVV